MITTLRNRWSQRNLAVWLIVAMVLVLAFLLGQRASKSLLGVQVVGWAGLVLLAQPVLGLPALVLAALVAPIEFNTGSAVVLNPASLLVPVLLVIWFLDRVRQRQARFVASPVYWPLMLFLIASLLLSLIHI